MYMYLDNIEFEFQFVTRIAQIGFLYISVLDTGYRKTYLFQNVPNHSQNLPTFKRNVRTFLPKHTHTFRDGYLLPYAL